MLPDERRLAGRDPMFMRPSSFTSQQSEDTGCEQWMTMQMLLHEYKQLLLQLTLQH
jgi:hypothetical protein